MAVGLGPVRTGGFPRLAFLRGWVVSLSLTTLARSDSLATPFPAGPEEEVEGADELPRARFLLSPRPAWGRGGGGGGERGGGWMKRGERRGGVKGGGE